MFGEEFAAVSAAAKGKLEFLRRNPLGYVFASMLAGFYVGFGVLLAFSIGGQLTGQPYAKTLMGISFGVALCLVIAAGAELFTGNNMVMACGVLGKTTKPLHTARLWLMCFIGNWLGGVLLALMFYYSGLASGSVGEFMAASAAAKMAIPFLPLFLRGMLCNMLVCLGVWCSFRLKSESGKLIMAVFCLFVFVTSGFEHSVANMTLLTISLLSPFEAAVSVSGYFYNICVAALGNIAGGVLLVAAPYYMISKRIEEAQSTIQQKEYT